MIRRWRKSGWKNVRENVWLHRVILKEPVNEVDHKDHNGLNNRRENLRPCTGSQNCGNGRYGTGASGLRGVSRRRNNWNWEARITVSDKFRYLGAYATSEEAPRAYDAAAIEHFGEFATLNFPDDR